MTMFILKLSFINLERRKSKNIITVSYTHLVAAYNKAQETDCKNYHEMKAAMKAGMQECLEHYYEVFETKKFND